MRGIHMYHQVCQLLRATSIGWRHTPEQLEADDTVRKQGYMKQLKIRKHYRGALKNIKTMT